MAVEVRLLVTRIPVVVETKPKLLMYTSPAPFTKLIRFNRCAFEYPVPVLVYCTGEIVFDSIPPTVDVSCAREIYFDVPRPVSVEVKILLKLDVSPLVVLVRFNGEI